jgi:DNA polymerase-3 subunit epsilon
MKRRYVTGVDVETTGLDPAKDTITEIGAVLWDVDELKPAALFSATIATDEEVPAEIQKLTGITPDLLKVPIAVPLFSALRRLSMFASQSLYYVAHNAKFDREFLKNAAEKVAKAEGLSLKAVPLLAKPWIDTKTDLPTEVKTSKLVYLAAEHGFLNPFAHRAVFDVLTMLTVMSRYPFEEVIDLQASPSVLVTARTQYNERHLARDAGFHWNADVKAWQMNIKKCRLEGREFPFEVITEEVE